MDSNVERWYSMKEICGHIALFDPYKNGVAANA